MRVVFVGEIYRSATANIDPLRQMFSKNTIMRECLSTDDFLVQERQMRVFNKNDNARCRMKCSSTEV